MKRIRPRADAKRSLRAAAERALRSREKPGRIPVQDMQHLIHELQVHQIELEMQNDELRKAQAEVEESRARYAGLYDFAPVGYVTLNQSGLIVEANLTAASLLRVERSRLLKTPFSAFVAPEDRELLQEHRRLATLSPERLTCELRLMRKDRERFYALVESVSAFSPLTEKVELQSAIADITERRNAEEKLRESEKELKRLSSQLMNVQESERKRIAWEIHDGIGQVLGGIKYTLESVIKRMVKEGNGVWVDSLQCILPMLQSVFVEVRRIQSDLRPPILDDLGLETAVAWSCRQLQESGGAAQAEAKINLGDTNMSESLKITIFRVVQEGLANIAKHSKASRVWLSLLRKGRLIELVIRDDGCGFDLRNVVALEESQRGIGLSSMKERTERIGGTFSIDSETGKGTTLRASWPLPPPAATKSDAESGSLPASK